MSLLSARYAFTSPRSIRMRGVKTVVSVRSRKRLCVADPPVVLHAGAKNSSTVNAVAGGMKNCGTAIRPPALKAALPMSAALRPSVLPSCPSCSPLRRLGGSCVAGRFIFFRGAVGSVSSCHHVHGRVLAEGPQLSVLEYDIVMIRSHANEDLREFTGRLLVLHPCCNRSQRPCGSKINCRA